MDKFSAISHLIQWNVGQALTKIGFEPDKNALKAYCEHYYSKEGQKFITLDDQDDLGFIEFHPLKWDSEIYGINIGAFGVLTLGPDLISDEKARLANYLSQSAVNHAFNNQTDIIICRVPIEELLWIQALEGAGFRTMDIQCPMTLKEMDTGSLDVIKCGTEVNIRNATHKDIEEIVSLGKSAFGRSHLYADQRLPKVKTDELHEKWLINDCNGRADFVLVAEERGHTCAFIAGLWDDVQEKILGFRHGHIDLIAVTENMHKRGIGSQITAAALKIFFDRNAHVVTVSTQGTNMAAVGLYQSFGFNLSGFEVTMHAWMKRAGENKR